MKFNLITINTACNNPTIFVIPAITNFAQLPVNGNCSPDFKIRIFSCIFINDEIYDRTNIYIHVVGWNSWRDNKPANDQCTVNLNLLIYKHAPFSLVLILCPLVHVRQPVDRVIIYYCEKKSKCCLLPVFT